MRLLLAAAAALALAGCQVQLEGAACTVPGSSDQCPAGQRCGVDQRCASSPLMTCPAAAGGALVVDPGAPAGAPAPTGARTPAACRFRSLDQALAAAEKGAGTVVLASGDPTAVLASGDATTYPVTATLAIPAGVTLRGDDDRPTPARRVLSLEGSLAAGVTLAEGATLSGFTLRNDSAAASAVGVEIACAAGGAGATAWLIDVVVDAAGATSSLASGIRARGACPVGLTRVTVQGASGAGLLVARDGAADTLRATDATFDSNGLGVHVIRGDVTLETTAVTRNAAEGVKVEPATDADALLTMDHGSIRLNGDTGVAVPAKQAGRLRLTGTRVCGNGAASLRGAPYAQRKVGGIYLFGNPPPDLAVRASAIFLNAGDQILVAGVGGWPLDGAAAGATACDAGANLVDGYAGADGGTTYVGVFAANATVTANWNAWRQDAMPLAGTDYAASGAGSVTVGTFDWCTMPAPTCD